MAKPKRPKLPKEPYHVVDADGDRTRCCKTLTEARRACADDNRFYAYDAPHRIYVLVTLEERRKEQRIIRAARKLVKAWDDGAEPGWRAGVENLLSEAVEAARGK